MKFHKGQKVTIIPTLDSWMVSMVGITKTMCENKGKTYYVMSSENFHGHDIYYLNDGSGCMYEDWMLKRSSVVVL